MLNIDAYMIYTLHGQIFTCGDITYIAFHILQRSEVRRHISDKESLALVVACLCHDLDHRGTNNAFQQKWVDVFYLQYSIRSDHSVFVLRKALARLLINGNIRVTHYVYTTFQASWYKLKVLSCLFTMMSVDKHS